MICKNCKHPIKKIKNKYTHIEGGTECKRVIYDGLPFGRICSCCKAETNQKEVI